MNTDAIRESSAKAMPIMLTTDLTKTEQNGTDQIIRKWNRFALWFHPSPDRSYDPIRFRNSHTHITHIKAVDIILRGHDQRPQG